jgi:hypothetical protein
MACSRLRPVFLMMLSIEPSSRSVSVKPGQTALTVTPLFAVSSASERTRPMTACFAAL